MKCSLQNCSFFRDLSWKLRSIDSETVRNIAIAIYIIICVAFLILNFLASDQFLAIEELKIPTDIMGGIVLAPWIIMGLYAATILAYDKCQTKAKRE